MAAEKMRERQGIDIKHAERRLMLQKSQNCETAAVKGFVRRYISMYSYVLTNGHIIIINKRC